MIFSILGVEAIVQFSGPGECAVAPVTRFRWL